MIKLGTKCKDCVTGIDGIVVAREQRLGQVDRFFLQAYNAKEDVMTTYAFNEGRLTATKTKDISIIVPEELEGALALGAKATDAISGIEGWIIARTTHLAMPDMYTLDYVNSKDNLIHEITVEEARLTKSLKQLTGVEGTKSKVTA